MRSRLAALALWAGALCCLAPAWGNVPAPDAAAGWRAQAPAPKPDAGERGATTLDCTVLASYIRNVVAFRDTGADPAKVIALFRRANGAMPEPRKAAVEREIRRMWREELPAGEAEFALYKRCEAQLGDMGREG